VTRGQGDFRRLIASLHGLAPAAISEMHSSLFSPHCRGLMRATLHLVNREFEALADDFVTLGMLPKAEVRGRALTVKKFLNF